MKLNISHKSGQSFLETTFAMVMAILLMVGLIKVFLWTGADLVKRRQAHEFVLTDNTECTGAICALKQLRPVFYKMGDMGATVNSDIFGE